MAAAKKGKKEVVATEPGSDPQVLYTNYLQSCKYIGIEPSTSLKKTLTNEDNPNMGTQIIIVGSENDMLGPGGCRALVNAMIGKVDESAIVQHPFTATKDLRINRSGIKDGGAVAISTLLFATARRKSIDTAQDGVALVQPEWKLEYLELLDNSISCQGATAIGRSLSVGMNKTLTSLVIDFNNTLGSEGLTALCKGLSTNSTLKKLSAKHCGIDARGGVPIAKLLKFKRTGLIWLDLTCNRLGAVGLTDICSGLVENASLKTLRLADNLIGRSKDDLKSLEDLADALTKNQSLTAVDLFHNKIGSEGGSILLAAMRCNKQITDFKVDSNGMNDVIYNELFRMSIACVVSKKTKKKVQKKN